MDGGMTCEIFFGNRRRKKRRGGKRRRFEMPLLSESVCQLSSDPMGVFNQLESKHFLVSQLNILFSSIRLFSPLPLVKRKETSSV